MRRIQRATLLVVGSCLLALLGIGAFAGPSSAASTPYPPPTCASISVSSTVVSPGEAITVDGSGFVAGATVHILFDSTTVLATASADANGEFSVSVTMPTDATGNHTISADGQAVNCPADPIQIEFQVGPGSGSHTPATTGFDIFIMVAAAGVLLASGLILMRGGRRRRASHAA